MGKAHRRLASRLRAEKRAEDFIPETAHPETARCLLLLRQYRRQAARPLRCANLSAQTGNRSPRAGDDVEASHVADALAQVGLARLLFGRETLAEIRCLVERANLEVRFLAGHRV